jgi:hypothetical protein
MRNNAENLMAIQLGTISLNAFGNSFIHCMDSIKCGLSSFPTQTLFAQTSIGVVFTLYWRHILSYWTEISWAQEYVSFVLSLDPQSLSADW